MTTPVEKDSFPSHDSDVAIRLSGLEAAVRNARGHLDPEVLAPAEEVCEHASKRLTLSGDHTIVALAGATGSGKSSLFNSLTDLELAGVGVRRPTTSWALACAWGPDGAQELLEWMGIPARHQVSRMSMLDRSSEDTKLEGLVLLDLPDHDSTEIAHHLEMDRLVDYADLLVWVLDPQKYADAALHDRYIKPLASHVDVTMVVLNQIDTIPNEERCNALSDVRKILAEEGLKDAPVFGVSATRGDGIDDFKRELTQRIRARKTAKSRLDADIIAVAQKISEHSGTASVPGISGVDQKQLEESFAQSAGVPSVVEAISSTTRRRAMHAMGWPVLRWLRGMRHDPVKDLAIDAPMSPQALIESSVPSPTRVQRADAELAVREVAEKASVGLGRPWADAVRTAVTGEDRDIVDSLDEAVRSTDLGITRPSPWFRIVNLLQWLLVVAAVVGAIWWIVVAILGWTNHHPSTPHFLGWSLPGLLLIGGLVLGIVVAFLARIVGTAMARRKARDADLSLRRAIGAVARAEVLDPIEAELSAYAAHREGLLAAFG